MRTPSLAALTRWTLDPDRARALKRILTADRAALEATPAGADRLRECYHPPQTWDLRMTALDACAGTYGVEAFRTRRGEWVTYLNTGDTYALTILRWRGNYWLRDWGSIAELHGAE